MMLPYVIMLPYKVTHQSRCHMLPYMVNLEIRWSSIYVPNFSPIGHVGKNVMAWTRKKRKKTREQKMVPIASRLGVPPRGTHVLKQSGVPVTVWGTVHGVPVTARGTVHGVPVTVRGTVHGVPATVCGSLLPYEGP